MSEQHKYQSFEEILDRVIRDPSYYTFNKIFRIFKNLIFEREEYYFLDITSFNADKNIKKLATNIINIRKGIIDNKEDANIFMSDIDSIKPLLDCEAVMTLDKHRFFLYKLLHIKDLNLQKKVMNVYCNNFYNYINKIYYYESSLKKIDGQMYQEYITQKLKITKFFNTLVIKNMNHPLSTFADKELAIRWLSDYLPLEEKLKIYNDACDTLKHKYIENKRVLNQNNIVELHNNVQVLENILDLCYNDNLKEKLEHEYQALKKDLEEQFNLDKIIFGEDYKTYIQQYESNKTKRILKLEQINKKLTEYNKVLIKQKEELKQEKESNINNLKQAIAKLQIGIGSRGIKKLRLLFNEIENKSKTKS